MQCFFDLEVTIDAIMKITTDWVSCWLKQTASFDWELFARTSENLLWKKLDLRTLKSMSKKMTKMLLEATWILYMLSTDFGTQSEL